MNYFRLELLNFHFLPFSNIVQPFVDGYIRFLKKQKKIKINNKFWPSSNNFINFNAS